MEVTLTLSPPTSSAIAPKSGSVATTLSLACAVAVSSAIANKRTFDFIEFKEFIVQIGWLRIYAQRASPKGIQTASKLNDRRRCHCGGRSCIAIESWKTRSDNKSGWARCDSGRRGPSRASQEWPHTWPARSGRHNRRANQQPSLCETRKEVGNRLRSRSRFLAAAPQATRWQKQPSHPG